MHSFSSGVTLWQMLMSGVGFHSNIDWKEERKTEWEIPVMHCLQSMVIGNTENKAHNFWDMQPLWCKQYITLMYYSITKILNLSQRGMDLINEWLAASHFHFPPTCKLKISSCNLSHCEYSRWHCVKRNFQFYTRQQLRENLGFLFFAYTSRCIAVILNPIEGIYQMQFPWSCSLGLAFSDTAISDACQMCATKSIGQYLHVFIMKMQWG